MSPRDLFDRDPDRFSGDDEIVQRVKLHDLTMALHYGTGRAVLVSETGDEAKAVWIPKSQVEVLDTGMTTDVIKTSGEVVAVPLVVLTLPEWLAKEKGLI